MKNNFPTTSVSQLEDIRLWLPDLSGVPPSRELVLINFNLRTYGDLIANFDSSRVPMAVQNSEVVPVSLDSEVDVSKGSNPLPPISATPVPTIPDSLPSTSTCSVRSTRGKTARNKRVGNMVDIPEVLINPPSDMTIRVKRSVRVKKASEKVEENKEVEFPHKVCSFYHFSFCQSYFFLFSAIFALQRTLPVFVP